MTIEILLAIIGGGLGVWGGVKRDTLLVGVAAGVLALALVAAWAISG